MTHEANSLLLAFAVLTIFRPVAQLAEQRSPKPQVGGSIPSWPAIVLLVVETLANLENKYE